MRPLRRPGSDAADSLDLPSLQWCPFVAVWLLCSVIRLQGQSPVDSALHGIVLGPLGEPVPHARIVLRAVETASERSLYSAADGTFLFSHLVPGDYSVGAASPSFFRLRAALVTLALGETTEVRLPLGLRALAERVDVEATSDSSPLDTSVVPLELAELPLDDRRWQDFALLAPQAAPDQDGDGLLSFRGLASTQNSVIIDGVDGNQSFSSVPAGTGSDPVPDPDDDADSASPTGSSTSLGLARGRGNGAASSFASGAVREFHIASQSYSALSGHAAGGIVTAITRSGGSTLHGSASLLFRSSALAATNPLSIASSYANGVVTSRLVKPHDQRETLRGTVGGPLFPTYLSTHRLFYFYSFEGLRRDFPAISSPTQPSFFALTSTQTALLARRGVKATAIDSSLTYLNSLTGSVPRSSQETIHFGKLDWQTTARHTLGLQFNHLRSDAPSGVTSAPTVARGRASLGNSTVALDSFVPRLSSTFGPRLANDLRLQISHDLQYQRPQPSLIQEPATGSGGQSPEINIGPNGFLFGTPAALSRQAYPDESRREIGDTLTISRGHHLLQVGADISLIHDLVATLPNAYGTFHYDSTLTNGHAGGLVDWITDYTFNVNAYPNGACPSITAKVHLFCFRSFTQSFGVQSIAFDTQEWASFLQDQWRLNRSLTLSAGVRYEYELLPFPQQPNSSLDFIFGKIGASSVFPEDRNNIGPRLALSAEPLGAGRGVLRLGYGVFFGRLPGATIRSALANTALPRSDQTGSTTHIRITPATITSCPQVANQGFGYPCAYTATPPATIAATTSASVLDRRFRLPMIQQGSLSFERDLTRVTSLGVTYALNLDRQLPGSTDLNIAPSTVFKRFQLNGATGAPGVVPGETFVVPLYTTRLTPLFGPVTDILSDVTATYHALTFTLNRSTFRGLTFHAHYTWSKAIDFGQNAIGTPRTNAQFDPYNIRYDRALSSLNYPQSFTFSAVLRPVTETSNSLLRHTLNNWSLAPILTVRSGRPYTLQIFGGTALSGGHESINGSGGAVYLPTVGRNTLRLPATTNLDLRLARTVTINPDHLHLRFTAEAFNLANSLHLSSVEQRAFLVGTEANGLTPLVFQDAATIALEGLNTQPFGAPTSASTNQARERQVQLGFAIVF